MRLLPEKPSLWQVILILGIGIFTVSTSAIFIRLAIASANLRGVGFSLFLAASRLTLASLILLPTWRQLPQKQVPSRSYYFAVAAGVSLAFHFATWITSLSFTSIVASTTLVTTNPVWVALFSWVWFKERLSRLTILGIAIALIGGIFIAFGDTSSMNAESNPLLGDILALIGAVTASLYLLFGREAQKQGLTIGNYVAIAYTTAAIILLPLPFLFKTSYAGYPTAVYLAILAMAIFPQLIGHTSFNWAVRWISPTFITLAILFEPVFSSLLGFVIFGEVPGLFVLLGAMVLLGGVAIATWGIRENA